MYCSLLGSSAPGNFQARILEWVAIASSLPKPTLQQNLKHQSCLAIWSTAMTQLQLNSINATRTNSNRRGKAQHRHSARVPSESAGGCISLSPILPCSEALLTKDRARPRTLSVSRLALLTAKPRQDWSRALGPVPYYHPR